MPESFVYEAPGKAILFGEHFVVHGARAVVCSIDRRAVAESSVSGQGILSVRSALQSADMPLDAPTGSVSSVLRPFHHMAVSLDCGGALLSLRSDIPVGSGLGSSSACCVAAAGSLLALCEAPASILDVAVAAERSVYPDSSGVDCAACMRGGAMSYVKGFQPVPSAYTADLRLVIADSGVVHSTPQMVERVGMIAKADPAAFSALMAEADAISAEALERMARGDIRGLGCLATKNQALLERVGVSNDTLRRMMGVANRHSYGSKITGAGGGGCIVAFADASGADETVSALTEAGYRAFVAQISAGAHAADNL